MSISADTRQIVDLPRWAFVCLAVGLPLVMLAIHRQLGHQGDLRFFYDWYQAFLSSSAFYRDGPGINYPIVGVLSLCVPAWLIESITGARLSFEAYRDIVKITLALSEVALTLAFCGLARALELRRPRLIALALYGLPSTWGIGAWFGQIDVLGTLWLVIAALGAVKLGESLSSTRRFGWLLVCLAGLHLAILTKQLTFFSIPFLVLALGLGLSVMVRAESGRLGWAALAITLVSPLLWFIPDLFLTLPDGYGSHLVFVLTGGGSAHGDIVCASGASLWALIYPGSAVSSRETLLAGVPVRTWALTLFGLSQLLLLACLVRARGVAAANRSKLAITFMGLSNLAMTTLLTGVHERYLVHGVPFLVLGLSAQARQVSTVPDRILCGGAWIIGAWTGLFVLSTIHSEVFSSTPLSLFGLTPILSVLQLVLLLALLADCVRRMIVHVSRAPRHEP